VIIIGVDYHPSMQQIAFVHTETGECGERELNHSAAEAEKFYRDLKQKGVRVRVGMEATGPSGDQGRTSPQAEDGSRGRPTPVEAVVGRSFPARVGPQPGKSGSASAAVASTSAGADENSSDEPVASHMNEGVRLRKALWSKSGRAKLESLQLAPWAAQRRQDLLELLDQLTAKMVPQRSACGGARSSCVLERD
jgi:transposase